MFFGEFQELCRKLAYHVTIERHNVGCPKPVEDGKQEQWVFGRISQRFCLLDKQPCPLHGLLWFRRRIAFDVEQRHY
jgi:hypothetical protein